MLLPAETYPVLEERRGKKNLVSIRSSKNGKVILKLLTEIVAVHVGLSEIYIQGMGL